MRCRHALRSRNSKPNPAEIRATTAAATEYSRRVTSIGQVSVSNRLAMSTTCRCWNCPPITPTNRQAARRHPHVGARNITQANIQNRRFASVTATEIKKTSKPFLQPSHLKHIVHLFVKAPVPNGRKYNGGSAGLVLRYSLAGQACDLNPIGTPTSPTDRRKNALESASRAPPGLWPLHRR